MRGRPSPQEGLRRRRDVLSGTRRYDRRVLDHLSIQCSDIAAATAFYDAVLPTIGGGPVMRFGDFTGYGVDQKPSFWIGPLTTGEPNREVHIAFVAADRAAVRAWFDAAVAAGAEVLHEPAPLA